MCLLADLTLMLAWNADEAGKVVETYKMFETKPPDLIMARAQQYPHQKVIKKRLKRDMKIGQIVFLLHFVCFPNFSVSYSAHQHQTGE